MVRKWPLASPMDLRRPNQAHRHHPHTMGDDPYTWFGRRPGIDAALPKELTQRKVLDFSSTTIYSYSAL